MPTWLEIVPQLLLKNFSTKPINSQTEWVQMVLRTGHPTETTLKAVHVAVHQVTKELKVKFKTLNVSYIDSELSQLHWWMNNERRWCEWQSNKEQAIWALKWPLKKSKKKIMWTSRKSGKNLLKTWLWISCECVDIMVSYWFPLVAYPGFKPQVGPGVFVCEVCMFSLWLCGFSLHQGKDDLMKQWTSKEKIITKSHKKLCHKQNDLKLEWFYQRIIINTVNLWEKPKLSR